MTDSPDRGIWRFARFYHPLVPPQARLSLGEGDTPAESVPGLAEALGLETLVLKREDLNPTGSHKARGLAFQVAATLQARPDVRFLTLSSSGNAAVAAAAYCELAGVPLVAFLAPGTAASKLRQLRAYGAHVFCAPAALSLAAALAEARDVPNLRPSTDPLAVEGFQSIGWELAEALPAMDALFTFASSGTSLVAIGRALQRAEEVVGRAWTVGLHVVQGTGAQPIAGELDDRPFPAERGRVGALGAVKTRRVGEAKRLVLASGGSGWVITDAEADRATELLLHHGIASSLEGAAALAAAGRAAKESGVRRAVVIVTGRAATEATTDSQVPQPFAADDRPDPPTVHDLNEVLRFVDALPVRSSATLLPPSPVAGATTDTRG